MTNTDTFYETAEQIEQKKLDEAMLNAATLGGIYRFNLPLFVKEYLGINLYRFQEILLTFMNKANYFMFIGSRGIGKTFLVALYCCCISILYPGITICVVSKTRRQGNAVLEKIKDILMPMSANLRSEINPKEIVINTSEGRIKFLNNSIIKVATAADTARGLRANILVIDEFRLIPKIIIDTILRKFLTTRREPKYLENPEYKNLREENKEIYLTSAWFKSHWSFGKFKDYCAKLLDDKRKYFVCGLPYQLAVKEGMFSEEQMKEEMSESDFSEISWSMEMECLFFGDNEGSFFTYEDVTKTRQLKTAVYPRLLNESLPQAKLKIPPLIPKERRILSVDVALLASTRRKSNDAASIWINSALPTKSNKYIGNFIYAETHEGLLTQELALKVRKLYSEYECTDLVIDVKGVGIGVYDYLITEMYDPETGITYPALSCRNNLEYAARCLDKTAPKVIWAITGSTQFNSDMYLTLREGFKSKKINLLISEVEFEEEKIEDIKGIAKLDPEMKLRFKMPYIETTLLVMELIELQHESKGNLIRVYEKANNRKDRVSSVGYNYYVQCQLERNLKETSTETLDLFSMMKFRQPKIK